MIDYPSQVRSRKEISREIAIERNSNCNWAEKRTETRDLSTAEKVAGRDVTELPLAGMELALADEELTRELSGYYTRIETRNVLLTGKGAAKLGLIQSFLWASVKF